MLPGMTDPDPNALAAAWRDRRRGLDFADFAAAVRRQPGLPLPEMVALDEAVSNPGRAARPCFRLLGAHLAAHLAPPPEPEPEPDESVGHFPRRRPAPRPVPLYRLAPEFGVNTETLRRTLAPRAPLQRPTAARLYAALAERGGLRADALDDELMAELFRPRWGRGR